MRVLLAVLAGILVGVVLSLSIAPLWMSSTPYSAAMMTVMQHELGALRAETRAGRCGSLERIQSLTRLGLLANDIERARSDLARNPEFVRAAVALRDALDTLHESGDDCTAQQAALAEVGQGCKACHEVFRGRRASNADTPS